jgi:hypothetical protein
MERINLPNFASNSNSLDYSTDSDKNKAFNHNQAGNFRKKKLFDTRKIRIISNKRDILAHPDK